LLPKVFTYKDFGQNQSILLQISTRSLNQSVQNKDHRVEQDAGIPTHLKPHVSDHYYQTYSRTKYLAKINLYSYEFHHNLPINPFKARTIV